MTRAAAAPVGHPAGVPAARPSTTPAAAPWRLWFVVLSAIWGCSFWFMKVGLRGLSPLEVAFWRLALGAVALVVILAVLRIRPPRDLRTWGHLAVVAVLLCSVPFSLFAYGETHVSSVLAGLINAATPIATLAVTMAAYREQAVTRSQVAGLAIGFVGVAVLLGGWSGIGGDGLLGSLACLGAICCYGLAYPYARRHLTGSGDGPVALAAGQVVLGALLLVPVLPFAWGGGGAVTADVVAAMLALGVLGSGMAYVLNYRIVAAAGATTASTVTYLIPLFAVVAGVAFLGESLTWNEPVGGAVVLLGVAVGSGRIGIPAVRRGAAPSP